MADAPMGIALQQLRYLFDEGTIAGLPDGQLLERFLARGDQAAFAALVRRHGPMVLSTCRSVLRDPNDTEDAFQATFLVLIGKARSIRGGDALGTWLHRVAHRIALEAGTESARRRTCERRAGALREGDRLRDELADDTRQVLHEELARLSEKYRLPVLLCDLEGKSYAQAATELKWGEATVRRRLAGADELLRSRLLRRGVTLTAVGLGAGFGRSADAAVPAAWIETTVKAAEPFTSGAARIAIGEIVTTTAAELARKSLRAMLLSQLRAGAASVVFLVALVGIAWGVGTYRKDKVGARDAPRMEGPRSTPVASPAQARDATPAESHATLAYRGKVLDPVGRPFPGAAVYLVTYGLKHPDNPPVRASSGADGQFHFDVPRSDFDTTLDDTPWSYATIVARAPGYGFGVANDRGDSKESTLKLARDDVPISGRIIDLEGRPVAGASLTVLNVRFPAQGSLEPWLKALEERQELHELERLLTVRLEAQPDPPIIPPVVTGPDGRFRIAGIGRERVVGVQIEGPRIETKRVNVLTRPGPTLRFPGYKNSRREDPIAIYPETFEHAAAPTRPIEGVVSDADTGRPLAGIMVHGEQDLGSFHQHVETISDAEGHYRLVGLPQGREGNVVAIPPCDFHYFGSRKAKLKVPPDEALPYIRTSLSVGEPLGPGPAHLDIKLKRGVWVTGRLIDKATGRPVPGQVEYFVFRDNPHRKASPGFQNVRGTIHFVGGDGTFRLVAFPGPGVLAARGEGNQYIRGSGIEAIKNKREDGLLYTFPNIVLPQNFNVLNPIDPAPGSASLTHDLMLESGRSLTVTVVTPDGKPLTGLFAIELHEMSGWETPKSDTMAYTVEGLKPGKDRTVGFLHQGKRLSGEVVLHGDDTRPQTVRLQPWAVLTGRVVDAEGQPASVDARLLPLSFPDGYPKVGKDGRFRIEGLIAGNSYTLQLLEKGSILGNFVAKDVKLGPGEIKDLGDIVPRP